MRTYDVARVKSGTVIQKPLPPLEEMDLREITSRYLTPCVKSYGKVSACMKCEPKCAYGQRAIELAMQGVGGRSETVPYEGSMLEKARRENELRRQQAVLVKKLAEESVNKQIEEPVNEPQVKKKTTRTEAWKEWFEESLKAEDQVQYVVKRFGISAAQARKLEDVIGDLDKSFMEMVLTSLNFSEFLMIFGFSA